MPAQVLRHPSAPAEAEFVVLPHSIEAEQAVLGSALANNAVAEKAHWLTPEDFFEPVHGRIWAAIQAGVAARRRVEPIAIKRLFDTDPALADLDGVQYLTRMAAGVEKIVHAVEFARTVKRLSGLRALRQIAEDMAARAIRPDEMGQPGDIIAEYRQRIEALCLDESRPLGKHVSEVIDEIEHRLDNPVTIWKTGIEALDESLGGGVPEGYVIGFEARAKNFKAQPVSEPVLLRDGTWRPIGQLRIGDELASPDGAPSRVVGVYPQGRRLAFRVTLSDGRSTLADAEHLWAVHTEDFSSGRKVDRIVKTEELASMVGRSRPVWLPRISGHFGGVPLPLDPYVLGVLLGDGSLTKQTNVRFSSADEEIVLAVAHALPVGMAVNQHGPMEYGICVAPSPDLSKSRDASHGVLRALRGLGLTGKGAEQKFIPELYFAASRADRLRLFQGLMDTDGQAQGGHMTFVTVSERLARDVQRLAWSLGMIARWAEPREGWYSQDGERRPGRLVYRLTVRGNDPREMCTLARKRAAMLEKRGRNIRLRVVSVEPDQEQECVCIRVTHPSSLYVTRDYILTHNSGCAHTILLALARQRVPACYFALEMGDARLVQRMLGQVGGFNSAMFRYADEHLKRRVQQARPELDRIPLWLVNCPGVKFSRLKAMANQYTQTRGIKAFVLDYWQLVQPDTPTKNKADFLAEVAQFCADHAHEHGTTWIIASQENRSGESYGSDGLIKACDWHATLHKHEKKTILSGPGGMEEVETLWMDVKYSRDGSGDPIGGEDHAILYIDKRGPHLGQLP